MYFISCIFFLFFFSQHLHQKSLYNVLYLTWFILLLWRFLYISICLVWVASKTSTNSEHFRYIFDFSAHFLCQNWTSVHLTLLQLQWDGHFSLVTCKNVSSFSLFSLSSTTSCQDYTKEGSRILSCWALLVCCVYLLCQRLRDYTVYMWGGWNLVRCLLRAKVAGREL